MKYPSAIIIGGTGQYGITLGKLLVQKNFTVFITSRFKSKCQKLNKKNNEIKFIKLNIYNKNDIKKLLKKYNPKFIFYFAGQSSPTLSFKNRKATFKSNYVGCKNFLEIIEKNKFNCKFLNAASSEMFGKIKGSININTPKNPVNPYGKSKKKSFNLVKSYREKQKIQAYNAILFNTESFLRKKNFLIPKICLAAINADKNKTKTMFNNIIVSREWNWCEEQCDYMLKFLKKKPQDFILSNGKSFSIKQMLNFAFSYFNLDYRNYITAKKNKLSKYEIKTKRSDYIRCLQRNNLKRKNKIFGKMLITKMVKYYLNEKRI